MEFKILTATHPEGLTSKVKEHIEQGWKPIGGHSVVEEHRQNRYSGQQHMDTIIKVEYSISMVKEQTNDETLKEAISILETLREDAEMALDDRWDRTDGGFEDQITVIDRFLTKVK